MRLLLAFVCFFVSSTTIFAQYNSNYEEDGYITPNYHNIDNNNNEIEEQQQHQQLKYGGNENYHATSQQPESSISVSAAAATCLARIRLAASFDPSISSQINRFIDSMRIDKLRSYVCERTAYFCTEHQQHEVGALFYQYDRAGEIIQQVRNQLSGTEKDQLNMMENLNDTIAEQSFFLYKFHQLNPVDLAVLTSAKASLTTALSANEPDAELSRAVGTFTPQDLARLESLPTASIPEEVRSHLARCKITSHDVINNTLSFLLSLRQSKINSYSSS